MHVTGVILAGGGARRFGGAAKGLAEVGGRRIIDRVADALATCTDELLLVANAPDADAWLPGVRTAGDLVHGLGALGGIHAALSHARRPVLVVAWDMPFVSPSLLAELRALAGNDVDAVAPEGAGGAPEPLCTWYAPSCLDAIERRLRSGDLRATGLLGDVRTRALPAERVRAHGDPMHLFLNVNDPPALGDAVLAARD